MSYKAKRRNSSPRSSAVVLALVAVLTLGVAAGSLLAQTQFGTVSGRVLDTTGAIVPGAKVTLTNIATNARQETTTNDEGLFVIANVLAGTYDVSVEKNDFKKTVQRAKVDVAQRLELNLALEVGQITEIVTVTETVIAVNTASGDLSRTITPQEVMNLPLLTRNPYNLVALAAGAVDTGSVTGDLRGGFAGDSLSGGIAVNGNRTSAINFLLDGGENNSTFTAGLGQTVPLDAVQEFRVQTNSMTAEFGRNSVVTNVITKAGGNTFHGSVYEYYRGAGLSTEDFNSKASGISKANFVRNQFGASGGGPIFKDRTFYFGSFEGIRVRSSTPAQFFVPTAEFLSNSSSRTQTFINTFGGPPASNCNDAAITAQQVVELLEGGDYSTNPLRDQAGAAIPASTQLFCRATIRTPVDSGGGAGHV